MKDASLKQNVNLQNDSFIKVLMNLSLYEAYWNLPYILLVSGLQRQFNILLYMNIFCWNKGI
jgi:hypothetical protein